MPGSIPVIVLRFADLSNNLLVRVKQDSNVSTLGSIGVAGRGEIIGARAILTFPQLTDFYNSLTFGIDYKHFLENTTLAGDTVKTPVTYYPLSANYTATWTKNKSVTTADVGLTFNIPGIGSTDEEFDFNRFRAGDNFIYLRSDVSHQRDLPFDFQAFVKVQGQVSDQPLVNSEQFAGGGLSSVRGYLEAETLGDNGFVGTVELRSPSLLTSLGSEKNEWRVYVFADGGYLTLIDPLPEQDSSFGLASAGVGTRIRFQDHLNGSLDAAVPFISQTQTVALDWRVTFRLWADF
jgi:hemolysin activation/secretion protein